LPAQSTPRWRIGVIVASSPEGYARQLEALRDGLRELGYVEGRHYRLDARFADNDAGRLPALVDAVVRSRPDVIVTSGPAIALVQQATRTIPVVMAATGDAVRAGYAASFARPGGNLTGSSFFASEINVKRLELLREAKPALKRVAVLVGPAGASTALLSEAMRPAASSLGLDLRFYEVRGLEGVEQALADIVRAREEALVVTDATVFVADAARICGRATEARILAIGFVECARGGGALAYGVDFPALWRRAAHFVDRILRGGRPAELPIERASTFELVVYPAAARRAGVDLPRGLVARADVVVD
jgi:putative ABC transport system substrate-binding protein